MIFFFYQLKELLFTAAKLMYINKKSLNNAKKKFFFSFSNQMTFDNVENLMVYMYNEIWKYKIRRYHFKQLT